MFEVGVRPIIRFVLINFYFILPNNITNAQIAMSTMASPSKLSEGTFKSDSKVKKKDIYLYKSPYPFKISKRTVIEGVYPDSLTEMKIYLLDQTKLVDWSQIKPVVFPIIEGRLHFEVNLLYPVYIRVGGRGGPINNIFSTNTTSKRFTASGLIVEPGDSLFLDESRGMMGGIESLIVSGRGAEKNWCQQEIIEGTRNYECPIINGGKAGSNVKLSDSIARMVTSVISKYKGKISPTAATILKAHYIPMFAPSISEIVIQQGWNVNSPSTQVLIKLEKLQSFRQLNLSNPDLTYAYNKMVPFYTVYPALLNEALIENRQPVLTDSYMNDTVYRSLVNFLPEGRFKDHAICLRFITGLREGGLGNGMEKCVNDYLKKEHYQVNIWEDLERMLLAFQLKLKKGSPAFSFALPDTTGHIHQFSDYKGKVIVMDFMFTGCIGCAYMSPFLKKIVDRYKGDSRVLFISVSIDKNREWQKKYSVNYFVPGTLFLHTEGLGAKHHMIEFYEIKSYPTIVVTDKNGVILSARAPDPTKDNGQELINLIESNFEQ